MTMAEIPTRSSERRVNRTSLRLPPQNFNDGKAYYAYLDTQYKPEAQNQVATNHPNEFIALLTGGHVPSQEEALEITNRSKRQYDSWKKDLLKESHSKSEVARLLQIEEASVEKHVQQGILLAVLEGAE